MSRLDSWLLLQQRGVYSCFDTDTSVHRDQLETLPSLILAQ